MAEGGAGTANRPRVAVERLHDFYRRVFEAVELPGDDAETVARVLIAADMRGIDSHGAPQARSYAQMIRSGLANPRPQIRAIRDLPGMAVLDGDNGLGPVVGDYAMRLAVAKAREVGVGTVTVRNSNHYASCFYYPLVAIEAGMAGMTITTSGPITLPLFGIDPIIGTNPYAIGFPGGNDSPPFLIDMATSAVAMGKVGIYRRERKTLPEGWTFDEAFQPTTDPDQARWLNLLGTDREHGSHKGYGLNVAGDLFCGLLSGGRYSAQVPLRQEGPLETSHMFTAWNVDAFVSAEEYRARFDEYTAMLRNSTPRDTAQPVLVPGDPEWTEEGERRRDGIPLHPAIYDDLSSLATELEISFVD